MIKTNNSFLFILFFFICLSVSCVRETKIADTPQEVLIERENITFILGTDIEQDNPFYQKAEVYFRYNEEDKTETVITHCHTLADVQKYLMDYSKYQKQAWGLINLVSHGNQYTGLSIKISEGGERATAKNH